MKTIIRSIIHTNNHRMYFLESPRRSVLTHVNIIRLRIKILPKYPCLSLSGTLYTVSTSITIIQLLAKKIYRMWSKARLTKMHLPIYWRTLRIFIQLQTIWIWWIIQCTKSNVSLPTDTKLCQILFVWWPRFRCHLLTKHGTFRTSAMRCHDFLNLQWCDVGLVLCISCFCRCWSCYLSSGTTPCIPWE